MSCGLHHVNTKRDLNNQRRPPALGHAERLGEAFASPPLWYSELTAGHNSTWAQSCGLNHSSHVRHSSARTVKSALQLWVTWSASRSVAPFSLKLSTVLSQAASPFKLKNTEHLLCLTDKLVHIESFPLSGPVRFGTTWHASERQLRLAFPKPTVPSHGGRCCVVLHTVRALCHFFLLVSNRPISPASTCTNSCFWKS